MLRSEIFLHGTTYLVCSIYLQYSSTSCMENYCSWHFFGEKLLKWQLSHVFDSAATLQAAGTVRCRAVHILIVDKLHISNHFGWKLEWHGVQKVIKKWFSNAAIMQACPSQCKSIHDFHTQTSLFLKNRQLYVKLL